MTWLLHFSDPHLGNRSPGQLLDDDKVGITQADLETTQRVFRRTLGRLEKFVTEHGKPAVVVVSGDIAYGADPSGFDAFAALIDDYEYLLPEDRARIVVVPGNHDVDWSQPAGTLERYKGFLDATREQGCVTPLLDGVDFAANDETGKLFESVKPERHLILQENLLLLPVNSSNWCGTLTDIRKGWTTEEWLKKLESLGDAAKDVMVEVDRLRKHDMARVSKSQIEAIGRLFDEIKEPRGREAGDERVRVAVLHHQLLPVSTREERKPFESLVNLALVRDTLRDHSIDIVLHGHKHESAMYWDAAGTSDLSKDRSQRVLVLSAPGHFKVDEPVMRAIRLTGTSRARSAKISTFLGPSSQRKHAAVAAEEPYIPLWAGAMEAESDERPVIRAASAHVAYARLQGLHAFRDSGEGVRNLMCVVDDPAEAGQLPPDYPDSVGSARSQVWFDDLVRWWQLPRSELVERGLVGFNHGERIVRRWGDQVARAARVINERGHTSRAIIQLVAPRETGRYLNDERDVRYGTFPAFVLAELGIIKRDGLRQLDCFAYFRKQELRYWWPVNLAELASIQRAVHEQLDGEKPSIGRIATFSAIALWSDSLPRVAVPDVDRLVDEPERLWALAAAIAKPNTAASADVAEWRRLLADLAGEGRKQPPQPRLGLVRLAKELARVAAISPSPRLSRVRETLDDLVAHHEAHENGELNSAAVRLVTSAVERFRSAVDEALVGAPPLT